MSGTRKSGGRAKVKGKWAELGKSGGGAKREREVGGARNKWWEEQK